MDDAVGGFYVVECYRVKDELTTARQKIVTLQQRYKQVKMLHYFRSIPSCIKMSKRPFSVIKITTVSKSSFSRSTKHHFVYEVVRL